MMSNRNHRAIVFHDLDAVPNQSSGYFTRPGSAGAITAGKDEHGVWYDDNGRVTPAADWVFTSHMGPANDAVFREVIREEMVRENLGITADQANTVVGALYEKLTSVEVYLASYRNVKSGPTPADECCDYHRLRFEARVEERTAFKAQRKEIEKLIRLFEGLAR